MTKGNISWSLKNAGDLSQVSHGVDSFLLHLVAKIQIDRNGFFSITHQFFETSNLLVNAFLRAKECMFFRKFDFPKNV